MKCKICGGRGIDHGENVGIIWDCDNKECGEIRLQELEAWLNGEA